MTKTAFDHHHHKPPHHHHHHDEETTAYSSWHDEEDSNSQLSSCLSSVDSHDVHAACVGEEEDEQFLHNRGSVILLSSPECPLLDHNDVEDDDIAANNCSSLSTSDYGSLKMEKEEVNNRMFEFQELSEQASYLLQRESSPEYAVDDYFQRSYYDVDNTSCRSPAHESTGGIEYLIPLSPDNSTSHRKSTPIDRSCRSKMMEWSYRIIEVSFPPPASQQQEHQDSLGSSTSHNQSRKRNIRQHSTESLQLISTTFSYIDRICTKFKVVDRDEYKFLAMVCLTLAAKSSGLFCTENEREWYEFFNNQQYSDACCKHEHRSEHTVTTASLSSSSSFDNIIDSSSSKNSEFAGQTILSTPGQDDAEMQGQLQQPRPLMDLISLPGLHALCNGLYTKKQLYEMEYIILHRGLDWRLNSVQAIDWLDLCLEISSLLHLDGNRSLAEDEYNDLREAAMVQLEYAVEISSFIGYAPSLLAVAAFLNAVDGYNDSGECILDCIEEVVGLSFDRSEMVKVRNIMRV